MNIYEQASCWNVSMTLPHSTTGHRYVTNAWATCVCPAIEDAIAMVRKHWPTATIVSVNKGARGPILVAAGGES